MATDRQSHEVSHGERGPWLVYVILALIVGLLALFLLLRPRGPRASALKGDLATPNAPTTLSRA